MSRIHEIQNHTIEHNTKSYFISIHISIGTTLCRLTKFNKKQFN